MIISPKNEKSIDWDTGGRNIGISHRSNGTVSYFEDIETSTGNTFQAGTWADADNLNIDISTSFVSSHKLHNVNVTNTGDSDITIIKLEISWTPDGGEKVTKVRAIGQQPAKVWEGNETSGATLDIKDCVLKPGESNGNEFKFLFNSKMEGKNFTIRFIMSDGSSKEVRFAPE